MGGVCICKDSVAVVRIGQPRWLTVGCCFPWRCKLRSTSPHRDVRAAVPARELCPHLPPSGRRPGLAPGCSANSSSPLSGRSPLPPPPRPAGCQSGCRGPNKPETWARGPMEGLPAGPTLHGRAPALSKQAVQRAAGHGQHATCH